MNDAVNVEAARLRDQARQHLREGTDPFWPGASHLLLWGWYERELARLETENARLGVTVDENYAARLQAEKASIAAVNALTEALPHRDLWDEATATELDDVEGPRR